MSSTKTPEQFDISKFKSLTSDHIHWTHLYNANIAFAEEGLSESQFVIGTLHEFGLGVAQDYEKAAEWFGRAAAQGHPMAQLSLGMCYLDGRGVPANRRKANAWIGKAQSQMHPDWFVAHFTVKLWRRLPFASQLPPGGIPQEGILSPEVFW
jgi:hypothetical protein